MRMVKRKNKNGAAFPFNKTCARKKTHTCLCNIRNDQLKGTFKFKSEATYIIRVIKMSEIDGSLFVSYTNQKIKCVIT